MSVNSFLFLPCVKPTSSANFALACSKLLIIFPLVSPLTPKALISPTVASTFVNTDTLSTLTLPGAYYLNVIRRASTGVEVAELTPKEIVNTQNNPLTAASLSRMVYVRAPGGAAVTLYPILSEAEDFIIDFYARPASPEWAYVVVNKRALYNANASTHFSLHNSEEEFLVARILQLAGIVIMKPGLVEIGSAEISGKKQQQNN